MKKWLMLLIVLVSLFVSSCGFFETELREIEDEITLSIKEDFIEYFLIADLAGILAFALGVLFSFVVGIFVIKFLLEYLKKGSFKIFAIYRVVIGLLVIAIYVLK